MLCVCKCMQVASGQSAANCWRLLAKFLFMQLRLRVNGLLFSLSLLFDQRHDSNGCVTG